MHFTVLSTQYPHKNCAAIFIFFVLVCFVKIFLSRLPLFLQNTGGGMGGVGGALHKSLKLLYVVGPTFYYLFKHHPFVYLPTTLAVLWLIYFLFFLNTPIIVQRCPSVREVITLQIIKVDDITKLEVNL